MHDINKEKRQDTYLYVIIKENFTIDLQGLCVPYQIIPFSDIKNSLENSYLLIENLSLLIAEMNFS